MHGETQANRLASLMQQKGHTPSYEFALPLVTVQRSDIKKLSTDDVFLLGVKVLEGMLIKEHFLCAKVVLYQENNRYFLEIKERKSRTIAYNSKKYEKLLFVLGTLNSRSLDIGHTIDISSLSFKEISVIHKKKKIAEASLVSVDGELAVKIDKVEKNG